MDIKEQDEKCLIKIISSLPCTPCRSRPESLNKRFPVKNTKDFLNFIASFVNCASLGKSYCLFQLNNMIKNVNQNKKYCNKLLIGHLSRECTYVQLTCVEKRLVST